jgi:hypothetical protein
MASHPAMAPEAERRLEHCEGKPDTRPFDLHHGALGGLSINFLNSDTVKVDRYPSLQPSAVVAYCQIGFHL